MIQYKVKIRSTPKGAVLVIVLEKGDETKEQYYAAYTRLREPYRLASISFVLYGLNSKILSFEQHDREMKDCLPPTEAELRGGGWMTYTLP